MDLGDEAPMEEPIAVPSIDLGQFMAAFEQALEQVTGETVDVEMEEEPPEEELPAEERSAPLFEDEKVVEELMRRVAERLAQFSSK